MVETENTIWKMLINHNHINHSDDGREFFFEVYYTLYVILNIKIHEELR